ncbi:MULTISPECIES: SIR2 family protein [unclassified Rathayibacter]|uniref:SIR2 family protein n=1 Tax=unclassified Rathayibacter TaxID=2609250 RepID=UPI0011B0E377|nr:MULTISPECIES: SIR2 family protein [unclassified Rathayibacter]
MIDLSASLSFAQLAVAMQSSPGSYALLAGAGVSRGAGLPTGWDVMIDLIGRIAQANGIELDTSEREEWWISQRGESLNYSSLLAAISPSPLARRDILRSYFEPSVGSGLHRPSIAHEAVARMVAKDSIQYIVTTNFDRLFENSFAKWNVRARVSTHLETDGLALRDRTPALLKINGDYLDLAAKNTEKELSSYSPKLLATLGALFANSGLVISGWSATWDKALYNLLLATESTYPTYWVGVGTPTPAAQRLIDTRSAVVVPADSADQLFSMLDSAIDAINERAIAAETISLVSDVGALRRSIIEDQQVFCRIENGGFALQWHEEFTLVAIVAGTASIPISFFWPRPEEVELEILAGGTLKEGPTVGATGAITYRVELESALAVGQRRTVKFIRRVRKSAERMPSFIGWSPNAPTPTFSLAIQFDDNSRPLHVNRVVAPAGDWPTLAAVGSEIKLESGYTKLEFQAPMKGYGYGVTWSWASAITS